MSSAITTVEPMAVDPKIAAYCTPVRHDLFSMIVHGNQIWAADPFDVTGIHDEARTAFRRLIDRAATIAPSDAGKSLLLLGESGSGKTHLLRVFRSLVHDGGNGYCGYIQLDTRSDSYTRYTLGKLIESLDQPYKPDLPETGLQRLGRGLIEKLDLVPGADREKLLGGCLSREELADVVHRLAYAAVQYDAFRGIDVNVMRAMLFTVTDDTPVYVAALQWLRCGDLSRYDRDLLGDLVPWTQEEMPLRMIQSIGRLIHAVHDAALVLLVDEIDEIVSEATGPDRVTMYQAAISAMIAIADKLPNAVVVIACLEDVFKNNRQALARSKLDRLERDPEPIRLSSTRTQSEIEELIARRLSVLFAEADVTEGPTDSIAPFVSADFSPLLNLRQRDILDALRTHREACILSGKFVRPITGPKKVARPESDWLPRWTAFHDTPQSKVHDDEPALAQLLAFAINAASAEAPAGVHFGADPDGRFVAVEVHGVGNTVDKLMIAVCDKSTRGGGLTNQVREVIARTGDIPAVLVRSTAFPTGSSSVVVQQIVTLIAPRGKGRRVVVSNSDWRALAAFRDFHAKHHADPGFADWQRADKPLSGLPAMTAILALDKLPVTSVAPVPTPPPPPVGVAKPTPVADPDAVVLGTTRGNSPAAVTLAAADFCRHAAFLGGSGSGKTTAALTVIEQLLLAGVPAVLIDRKGDLARYADPDAWTTPEPDAGRAERRAKLRDRVEVAVYTPGADAGRPLAIPVVPELAGLNSVDREQLAQYAAAGLGQMMGYKGRTPDPKVVILQKAIEVQGRSGQGVTVKALQQLVADREESLVNELGGFDDKHFKKLDENLLTLGHQHRRLLEGGEPLDIDELLGRTPATPAGKTRLSVVNTQSLGDPDTVDFWLSQFLLCVGRWASKHPSKQLQAVFLFDEADAYLPAVGKPATKAPMENLLKRARSAGVGVFLATQSPGDLDYKCRDQVLNWLVGRVKEPVAITKLKPMLDRRPDAADKLAGQAAGEFYLVRETGVSPIAVARNLVPTEQVPEDRILTLARGRG